MRMSCNGCRVLRKGCDKDCSIRPCLDWIKSSQSQSNATLFLAKFYGRTGLLNLINAGPLHLRPSIFRSLLYEACGRIVNPIYGSAGLYSTDSWHLCQTAVENVLNGSLITQAPIQPTLDSPNLLFKACDIRHVAKHKTEPARSASQIINRTRFKRSARKLKSKTEPKDEPESSYPNSVTHEDDSVSVETVENTLVRPNEPEGDAPGSELGLGLSLFPVWTAQMVEPIKEEDVVNGLDVDTWTCDLTLGLPILS